MTEVEDAARQLVAGVTWRQKERLRSANEVPTFMKIRTSDVQRLIFAVGWPPPSPSTERPLRERTAGNQS